MKLKYFQSIDIPDNQPELYKVMSQLESLLQVEHGIDGKLSNGNLVSNDDKLKLEALWKWMQEQTKP